MKNLNFNNFSTRALAFATLSVATLASCSKDNLFNENANANANPVNAEQRVEGQYIVVMKDAQAGNLQAVENNAQQILQENNIQGVTIDDDNTFSSIGQGFTAKLNPAQLEALKKDARIAYIEEDKMVALAKGGKNNNTTTNEPLSTTTTTTTSTTSTQKTCWGVTKVGGPADGTGKTAWILDSGIDPNHTDLNVDKTRSKSFLSFTQAGNYSSYADEFGHGTQIAGIIGAKNNSFGSVGVAPNASLVSLRVMDANGSALTSKIIQALNWVATYGTAGDVVSFSIGGGISTTLDDAVRKVAAKGIYVAIASGNNAGDCIFNSPARVDGTNIFTVSAMDNLGKLTSFSNYGLPVDYAAPGVNIYTTNKGGGYTTVGGTSYSAPHLAGILLVTGGKPRTAGYITGDKDGKADPIASR